MIVDGEGHGMAGFNKLDIWAKKEKSMILADEKRKGYLLAMFFCLDGAHRMKTELMPKRIMGLKRKPQRIYPTPSKQA